jgi:hypothetical protein
MQANPAFQPRFPGTYTLNYTTIDGCNPPAVSQVKIVAQCLTTAKPPSMTPQFSDYYCAGNPGATASTANGKFQTVSLSTLANVSSVQAPQQFSNPQAIMSKCAIPAQKTLLCRELQDVFNSWSFDSQVIEKPSDGNYFKRCCQCLYSFNLYMPFNKTTGKIVGYSYQPDGSLRIDVDDRNVKRQPSGGIRTLSADLENPWWEGGSSGSQERPDGKAASRVIDNASSPWLGLAVPLTIVLVASVGFNALLLLKSRADRSRTE